MNDCRLQVAMDRWFASSCWLMFWGRCCITARYSFWPLVHLTPFQPRPAPPPAEAAPDHQPGASNRSKCVTIIAPALSWQGRNEVRWRPGQKTTLHPHVRTWGLSEANLLYWGKYLWHCWDFSAPLAGIRRPGNYSPLSPSLRPCSGAKFTIYRCMLHWPGWEIFPTTTASGLSSARHCYPSSTRYYSHTSPSPHTACASLPLCWNTGQGRPE